MALAIHVIVESIRIRLPNTHIILVGLIPREDNGSLWFIPKIALVNKIIAKLNDDKWIHFFDLTEAVESSPEHVKRSLYNSELNRLSAAGYQLWYENMEPLFGKLYNSTKY